MSDMHAKLGRDLLKGLVGIKEKNGKLSLEDVGALFMSMAGSASEADQHMHAEIGKMAKYIAETKKEIFSMSTNDQDEQVIEDASQHLEEVVKATEKATNTIMDAADVIQGSTGGIGGDKEKKIMEATNRIYDACNFQDITGQRITRVIKLLANIDDRIEKLNKMFGDVGGVIEKSGPRAMTDKDLLNGPQLAGKASSQEDIDALFASLSGKK